ncbi:hypothetical protein PIB30_012635 [Stylosanthes scabra]|uniref:Uncharacterized protein n=1 Tax=Stylosanthes scabra TaxID=79078 RepID=A0ABU6Y4C5_9FABA|nr:hypothetical protein [Stylosanthes scabra]
MISLIKNGRLEETQIDEEWPEVECFIKELEKIEGIDSISKGRFFRSLGLAPTFQVSTHLNLSM